MVWHCFWHETYNPTKAFWNEKENIPKNFVCYINKLCNTLDTNLIGDIVEVDVDDVVDGDRAGA